MLTLRCPSRLQRILRDNEKELVIGQSTMVIEYVGEGESVNGFPPPKLFKVGIETNPLQEEFEELVNTPPTGR